MGAYLARQATPEHDLGAAGDTKWYDEAAKVAPDAIDFAKSLFGGGSSCSSSDKQRRQLAAQLISQNTTLSQRQQLVAGTESNISPNPEDMAYFLLGGKDCKHKNVTPGDQQFLDQLRGLLTHWQQQPADSSGSNLPANMTTSNGTITPAIKYSLYGLGLLGVAAAGVYGYEKYIR